MAEIIIHNATLIKDAKGVSVNIAPVSNDPINQTFDEESGNYVPDRSVMPLVLAPMVDVQGKDASASLSSQAWYMIKTDGTEAQITSATSGHELITTVTPMRLRIKVNTPSAQPSKYIYRCSVGQEKGMADITLRTVVNARPNPTLSIDAATSIAWNPFDAESKDVMKITPTIQAHGYTGLAIRWRKIEGGTVRPIDYNDPKDIELTADGSAIKVNRRLMGKSVSVVCELLNGSTIVDSKYVTITRRIPESEYNVKGSTIFTERDSKLLRQLDVRLKPGGLVSNPAQELLIQWMEGSAVVGEGNSHTYNVGGKETLDARVSVEDRGCWCLAVDADGKYFVDADGKYLLIR